MVVSSDLGHETNVHPKQKKPVGERLAKLALARTYGQELEYSGPVVESISYDDKRVTLAFTHAHGLQSTDGGDIVGFEVAGEDGVFYPARAKVRGATIELKSKAVKKNIKQVRYGWQPFTNANLINKEGLPASTFSSEYTKF